MTDINTTLTTAWLFNYFIHSSVFIVLALAALKFKKVSFDQSGEWLLKGCFVLGALTAFIQSSGLLKDFTLTEMTNLNWQLMVPRTTAETQPMKPHIETAVTDRSHQLKAPHPIEPQNTLDADKYAATQAVKPAEQTNWSATDTVPALLLIWLLGVVYLISKKLLQHQQLKKLLSDRSRIDSTQMTALLNEIKQQAKLKQAIKLSQSPHLDSPIALVSGEVVLPAGFCEKHSHAQIKAALAHELAHLKRLDGYWLWFSVVFEAVLFFQPLNKIITKQIHQLTEQRADDLAAQWTNNPKALAETLSAVAHDNFHHNTLPMVTAMTSKKSNLLSRIENLLLKKPSHKTTPQAMVLAAFISLAILFTAPGLSIHNATAGSHSRSVSIEDDGSVTDMSISTSNDQGTFKLKAKIKGKLKFNADETALLQFPQNSKFDLTSDRDGLERRLVIKSKSGQPVYTYYEDDDKMPYDAEAQDWFASIIPELLRTTGIDADARVVRIQRAYGDDAVLDEIELIDSDWVKKLYLTKLLTLGKLAENDLIRAINLSADINSDFELSKVLRVLIRHQDIEGEAMWQEVLNASEEIGSDFEMAKTLISYIDELPDTPAINRQLLDATKSIGSDFEMKKVLSHFMKNKPTEVNMIEMFEVAKAIGSDFELAKLLIEVNDQLGGPNEIFTAYLDLADTIGSDFELKNVYSHLLKYELDEENLKRLIDSAEDEIGSDFELTHVLLDVMNTQNLNANLLNHLKAAANSIGSDFERRRVLEELVNRM